LIGSGRLCKSGARKVNRTGRASGPLTGKPFAFDLARDLLFFTDNCARSQKGEGWLGEGKPPWLNGRGAARDGHKLKGGNPSVLTSALISGGGGSVVDSDKTEVLGVWPKEVLERRPKNNKIKPVGT